MATITAPGQGQTAALGRELRQRLRPMLLYMRRNPTLPLGLGIMGALLIFLAIGHITYDTESFRPLSARNLGGDPRAEEADISTRDSTSGTVETRLPPSVQYPFGTDSHGRDLYAVALRGTTLTLRVGLIAGAVSVGIGTLLAFFSAYYRGWPDNVIRILTDVGLAIPGLLILIIIAINFGTLSVDRMGLSIALVSWVFPARTIRAQVLVLREQSYVEIARLSGTSGMGIIFKEMMPNLIPYITASFVASVAAGILASIGLEALGLGHFDSPSIGMTIYWSIQLGAAVLGLWWWWIPPLITIVLIFISLFLISSGLDEWSNPRLRKRV